MCNPKKKGFNMAAAKGNKYSQIYTDKDIVDMGEDLIKWAASDNKQIHLVNWSIKHKKSTKWIYFLADEYPVFKEYLNTARDLLAAKLLTPSFYNGDVNAMVGMKYLPVYDHALKALLLEQSDKNKQNESRITPDELLKAIESGQIMELLKQHANKKENA